MPADTSPTVTLTPLTADTWEAGLRAFELGVKAEQQRFVSEHVPTAAVMMAKAYLRPAGRTWAPYLIEHAGEAIGMLQLVYGDGEDSDCWLYHFFIDKRFQGRGLGRSAMHAFVAMVEGLRPGAVAVCLTVHPENVVAQGLYGRIGFEPTGEMREGEAVYRLGLR